MCRAFKNRMRRLRRARRLRQATQPTSQATQLSKESQPAQATRPVAQTTRRPAQATAIRQPAQTIRQPAQTTRQVAQTTLRPARATPTRQAASQSTRRPAQATPQPTPTSRPSQPAQPSQATLSRKPGETPPAYRNVVKRVPDLDYPHLFDRAVPNVLCRDAISSIHKISDEVKTSIATQSKASETTKLNGRDVRLTLLAEAYSAILDLGTEEHWLDWVVCTFKACAVDIISIAGTSADDGTIDRELVNVCRMAFVFCGSASLLSRAPAAPRYP